MSIDNLIGGVQSLANTATTGLNLTTRALNGLGLGDKSKPVYWKDQLRPASFRGIPFGVLEGQLRFGRKVAVHEYPFRDAVWVEDLGRMGRRVAFVGFLVGDDCIAQRDRLIKVCEEAAAVDGAELVHPTLGRMNVSLADAVGCAEHWDRGRYFEIAFSFIEQGKRQFPGMATSTSDEVASAATAAQAATSGSFLQTVVGAIKSGVAAVKQVVNSVQTIARQAQSLVNDATNLYHYVQALPGTFGRLFGANVVRSGRTASVASLIAQGAVGRASVTQAGNAMVAAGLGLVQAASAGAPADKAQASLDAYTKTAHALAAAVAAAAPSPPDAVRLLLNLLRTVRAASIPTASTPAAVTMAGASYDLFRRALVIALAQAAARYQPTSYDDAVAIRAQVVQELDTEIGVAGDKGQDATYNALRALRAAIANDLARRGANLAHLAGVTMPQSMPSLLLAQRLYRDANRADELVAQAAPIHPAFMPRTFKALAR